MKKRCRFAEKSTKPVSPFNGLARNDMATLKPVASHNEGDVPHNTNLSFINMCLLFERLCIPQSDPYQLGTLYTRKAV